MPLRVSHPRRAVSKLRTRLQTRGPKEVAELSGHRVREFLHSDDRLILFALDLASPIPQTPARVEGVFRRATPEDACAYAHAVGTDSKSTFRARLSNDTRCYLVVRSDLIVHASWVTTSKAWTRELRRYFTPPPGEAYIYESFTREEARGQGAYPFALIAIAEDLRSEGCKRAWVGVEAGNASSIKAVRKAGFEPGFEVTYRRRFGRVTVSRPRGPLAAQCGKCLLRVGGRGGQISA